MKPKVKALLLIILGLIRSIFESKKFEIKRGYKHRNNILHYDDINKKEDWQKEVYEFASGYFMQNNFESILDIGCGSAYKLIKHFGAYEFKGVEIEPTLSKLKTTYPQYKWLDINEIKNISVDLIICADVIEHVKNPEEFLNFIISNTKFKAIIISTPDRDILHSRFSYGPTKNLCHFREWNLKEFKKFMSIFFNVETQFISNYTQATQVILAKNL